MEVARTYGPAAGAVLLGACPAVAEIAPMVRLAPEPGFEPRVSDRAAPAEVLDATATNTQRLLSFLESRPGWASLTADDQLRISAVMAAPTTVSEASRSGMSKMITSSAFEAASPEAQAQLILANFHAQPDLQYLFEMRISVAMLDAYHARAATVTLGDATPQADGSTITVATVAGKAIPIRIYPAEPGMKTSTAAELADGLAMIPDESRLLIKTVVMRGGRSPLNPIAFMDGDATGVVDVYAAAYKPSVLQITRGLIHESGHIVSRDRFTSWATSAAWQPYKDAIASDRLAPSGYARVSPEEDFAESWLTYLLVRGTPQEAATRALFPARFSVIDQVYQQRCMAVPDRPGWLPCG